MPDTFSWCPMPGATATITQRVRKAQFGDGYSQAVGDGLNAKVQQWALTFRGKLPDMQEIITFLDAHGGYISFNWTPPTQALAILTRCEGYGISSSGADIFDVTATFQQVFAP